MNSEGIVLTGSERAKVVSEAVAEPTGTQVLIRTHAVGLCGSDLGLYHGTYEGPKNYPLYFGHEWSGTIQAVGPDLLRRVRWAAAQAGVGQNHRGAVAIRAILTSTDAGCYV
jgi:D-arabinose 1-dehydrogenase-like Zn-dependent alcohol dehydrogenase